MNPNGFLEANLTAEEAFWVMFYFLEEHYQLSGGKFDLSDVLSASQPFEFDELGHFDGQVLGNRRVAPADFGMVQFWNDALEKFRKQGKPIPKPLKK